MRDPIVAVTKFPRGGTASEITTRCTFRCRLRAAVSVSLRGGSSRMDARAIARAGPRVAGRLLGENVCTPRRPFPPVPTRNLALHSLLHSARAVVGSGKEE